MKRKTNIKPRLPVSIVSGLPPNEHLFCLMVAVLGYSVTKAYSMAISPNIKLSSAAAMGCRLMQEERMQRYVRHLYGWKEAFIFNMEAIKYQ